MTRAGATSKAEKERRGSNRREHNRRRSLRAARLPMALACAAVAAAIIGLKIWGLKIWGLKIWPGDWPSLAAADSERPLLSARRPPVPAAEPAASAELPEAAVARFAELALACVGREYPNKLAHVLSGDADALPPRQLTPAFFGCFDWHSAVHGHWLLVRLLRRYPQAAWAERAREALRASLTPTKLQAEAAYLKGPERASFERPYGLAWLLQLAAELGQWDSADGRAFAQALQPLREVAVLRLRTWLPKLSRPVRSGEHSQTAFALGLLWDFARAQRPSDPTLLSLIEERARAYYLADVACPIDYEPSGEDFLSPCLAEADVMRRVLPPPEFGRWLQRFLPDAALDSPALRPQVVTDPTDGKLAHLDGLNLSRAFMLDGIAAALASTSAPVSTPKPALAELRLAKLRRLAAAHRAAGLRAVTGTHYAGTHWLGSFATYLVTGRGLAEPAAEQHP